MSMFGRTGVFSRGALCCSYSSRKTIKTDGSQNKGKVSVVRKKFLGDEEGSFEILEAKNSASVMKRFNWENKHLFGDVITAPIRNFFSLRTRKGFQKGVLKRAGECFNKNPLPIKDSRNISRGHSINDILDFPMTDKADLEPNEISVSKLNAVRQHLESLCDSGTMPSVTAVLEKTRPPERTAALERWRKNMIAQLGAEGFDLHQKEILRRGSAVHDCILTYLTGVVESDIVVEAATQGYWKSVLPVLRDIHDVRLIEERTVHPFLCYRGVVDCFGLYKNEFTVADWKTSTKPKLSLSSTFDSPLQIAAYVGALNFDPKYQYMVCKGLLAVVYEHGGLATVHVMEEKVLLHYWKQWLQRLQQYWNTVAEEKKAAVTWSSLNL